MSRPSSSARPRPAIQSLQTSRGAVFEAPYWSMEWPTAHFPYFVVTRGKEQYCFPAGQVHVVILQHVHDFDHEGNIIP
jgi:hypothetical protein